MKSASSTPSAFGSGTNRFGPGDTITARVLTTIRSERIRVPAGEGRTHLQFRRFAGCPICNLHLRSVARRHDEILAAGIGEVVVFHSPVEDMLPHQGELPFAAIADPDRELYTAFGVETAWRSVLHPRAWTTPLRPKTYAVVARGVRAGGTPGPRGQTMLGLPADFLIAPDGRILAAKYGQHADDQWDVDELLHLAQSTDH